MKTEQEDLSAYKKWGLTLLQLMGLLAAAGIVGNAILQWIFS
jgi:hypothetical protein